MVLCGKKQQKNSIYQAIFQDESTTNLYLLGLANVSVWDELEYSNIQHGEQHMVFPNHLALFKFTFHLKLVCQGTPTLGQVTRAHD